jgi:hypothetical protein
MTDNSSTVPMDWPEPLVGMAIERFLDQLPLLAFVTANKRMAGASDDRLDGWTTGISDACENVRQLVAEWRAANGQ